MSSDRVEAILNQLPFCSSASSGRGRFFALALAASGTCTPGGGAVSPRMTTNRGTAQWMAPECQLVENGLHRV